MEIHLCRTTRTTSALFPCSGMALGEISVMIYKMEEATEVCMRKKLYGIKEEGKGQSCS